MKKMKKTTSLLLLLFTASVGFAQWQQRDYSEIGQPEGNAGNYDRRNTGATGAVIVKATRNNPFTVIIDNNQTYQSNGTDYGYGNDVRIDKIYSGSHKLEVVEWRKNLFGNTKKYILYSGNIYVKEGVEVTVQLNGYGQPMITERQINNGNYNDRDNRWNKRKKSKKNNGCDDEEDDRRYRDNGRRKRGNY
jgi:hypothetical protein